jgi:secernin
VCDCLVAVGRPTLFAKNSDRPPDEPQRLEWHPPRAHDGRTTYIEVESVGETVGFIGSRPEWMWGVEHGLNQAGVAIGNETIYTTLDPRPFPPALTGMDLVRLGLERATSAAVAVRVITDLLERYGQGGSGHRDKDRPYWSSFLVADPVEAWVVETSGRKWEAERVSTVRAISNRTTIPSFDAAHRHPRQPVEKLVDPRWEASKAVLGSPPVTRDALQRHLRSHAGGAHGWTVCMHVEGVEATTASMVAELEPGADRPLGWFLLGSPCRSVYVPLHVGHPIGEPVPWERFAALTDADRPRLDDLERSLAADVSDDEGWPAEAWRRVEECLSQA